MTTIDWLIVALFALFALYGYGQGVIVGALTLGGLAAGAFLGTRLGPGLLPQGSASPYAPLFGLGGGIGVGLFLATGLSGLGAAVRARLRSPGALVTDGLLGAALTGCVALGLAWILGAVAVQAPATVDLRRDVQRSAILQRLNALLPPSGPILHALSRVDPFPKLDAPGARVAPPAPGIPSDPQVRAAAGAVVRVLGSACGLGIEGSGWVTEAGGSRYVVTNAHVVAGEDDTTVQVRGTGDKLRARAYAFDPTNDIAVLRVDSLPGGVPSLPLSTDPKAGTAAAILGFPKNGPYDSEAGRLGQTRTVLTEDAYGRGPVSRSLTSLRGRVRSGNSGGPMVDGRGRVVTTIFASIVGNVTPGGFGVPNAIVSRTLRGARAEVGTGPCAR
jgi:S1-C subfamily serine protease